MKRLFRPVLSLWILICVSGGTASAASGAVWNFSKEDRILLVAPHPDDEALGAGGLVQSAASAGASLRIVYLTQGESNEVSSIFYRRKPLLLKSDFIRNGRIRRAEAVDAMASLGLDASNLIFFGYPDFGTMKIWQAYWGEGAPAYRSLITRINKVLYKDDFSYGQTFKGENVVRDFERVLLDFQPTRIFVTAPFDLNSDHQAAFLFLQVARMNLEEQLKSAPPVSLYVVHAHEWPQPKKYAPELALGSPTPSSWKEPTWDAYPLTQDETEKKQKAILRYTSQIAYKRNFLLSFARANEIFAEAVQETVGEEKGESIDKALASAPPAEGDVRYRRIGPELLIDIPLSVPMDEMGMLKTYVFPYRKGYPFAEMPKLSFGLFGNRLFVKDGLKEVFEPGLKYRLEKKRLLVRLPVRLLKDPDHLFVSTRTARDELSLDFGSWRILEMSRTSGPPAAAPDML